MTPDAAVARPDRRHAARRGRSLPVVAALAVVGVAALLCSTVVAAGLPVRTGGVFTQLRGAVVPEPRVTRVEAAFSTTCAVDASATLQCWGDDSSLQLGTTGPSPSLTPVRSLAAAGGAPLARVNDLAVGWSHTCASLLDGTVRCSGSRTWGLLGDGAVSPSGIGATVRDARTGAALRGVRSVVAGAYASCALVVGGTVRCWGRRDYLGNGATQDASAASAPVVDGATGQPLDGATSVSMTYQHACAVRVDGTVRCWGYGRSGRLGYGGTADPVTAVTVVTADGGPALAGVRQLAAGGLSTCALLVDTTVRCWGDNLRGQLGNGTGDAALTASSTVLASAGTPLTGVASVSVGTEHACAVLTDGTARCWGNHADGRLGYGGTVLTTPQRFPVPVWSRTPNAPLTSVRSISAGDKHTCATRTDGSVWCWGSGTSGKLGIGDTSGRSTAMAVALLP